MLDPTDPSTLVIGYMDASVDGPGSSDGPSASDVSVDGPPRLPRMPVSWRAVSL